MVSGDEASVAGAESQAGTRVRNRILIFEDDQDLADVLVDIATRQGFEAIRTADPRDGLARAAAWDPDVILTDLQMPEVDGVALMRAFAERNQRAKFVIISGMEPKLIDVAARLARDRGLDIAATLTKPCAVSELAACLSRLRSAAAIDPAAIAAALESGAVFCHFQPKCDLRTGAAAGVEALVRWLDPVRGLIPTDAFLPIVERSGLADALLDRVLHTALEGVAALAGHDIGLAVNISATNAVDLTLPDRLLAACRDHGWPPGRLILELSEKVSMDESLDVVDVLARLRLMGFGLSIDDFGTGFSSLQRLQSLPFTELKIDRVFVQQMTASRDAAVIVKTLLAMSDALGLAAIAEGVETPETAAELRKMGCVYGQGFGLGRPMAAAELPGWIAARSPDGRRQPIANLR
jgi:EAL domain-containing protein (putative c-di-GMP-specific phosphodiesterase class I)